MQVAKTSPHAATITASAPGDTELIQLKEAARGFEAMFLNLMLSAMRQTVTDSGLITKSSGEKIYQSMLDQEHARIMSETSGPKGLATMIADQLNALRGGDHYAAAGKKKPQQSS